MKLSEILDTFESLDRAYDTVEEEVRAAAPGLAVPSWESIVRGRPRREPGSAVGELRCAGHGGAPHGLPHDALSDHLATEFAEWTRLAEHSDTVRAALGIEKVAPSSSGRIGAMLYVDGDLEIRARLSASGTSVSPTEAGRWLWVRETPEKIDFRPRQAAGEPYLLFSNDGKGRRWSFSDLRKGYEDYLLAAGRRPEPGALDDLGSAPIPRLLGAVSGYNARNAAERAPIAVSEAWLWDGSNGERAGDFAEPCPACKFGLSAWMCGHAEMLARGASANLDYAKRSRQWLEKLRDRTPPRRSRTGLESDLPPRAPAIPAAATAMETLVSGSPGSGEIAPKAPPKDAAPPIPATTRVSPEARAAVARLTAQAPLPELAESDVTGQSLRRTGRADGGARGPVDRPVDGGAGQRLRERVRIRLESEEFPCENVEVRELHGREALSKLFSFQIDIVCFDEDGLDIQKMLGASAALVFEQGSHETRRIHGMVAEVIDHLETESDWRSYRLWLAPRAWRSTLVETQEVYLDTNVPDLVQQKLSLVGLTGADVETRLLGAYPARELVVQYKETDIAFVSRLTEHLGICFFFEHDTGVDKVVFSDDNSGFRPLLGAESIPFRPRGEKVDVFELHQRSRAFPASFAMQDYNYRAPLVDLTSVFESAQGFGGGVVEYGAHYKTPGEGAALAKIRGEERLVENQTYEGKSDRCELSAGGTFELAGHTRAEGLTLLVVEVEHHARQTVKMAGAMGGDEPYRNTFRAVDARLPYRPPRSTPRPRIHGVLTAIVEPNPGGDIGEQARIDTDGRYTVKFYFDAGDVSGRQKHSRPVRMIQPHSGPNYGVHFPLKPGIEVLVVFMDGDPDRPMIVGSVPNPVTPSPVVQDVSLMNRIETASGLIIEMRDAVPPLSK